jgi:hypothetical protein
MKNRISAARCSVSPGPRTLSWLTAAARMERWRPSHTFRTSVSSTVVSIPHGKQWRYATQETKIATDWLLRLDADYQVSDALVAELARLDPNAAVSAYRVKFDYAVFSRKLRSSLYPPKTVLLRKGCFTVWDKGHCDAWDVHGPVVTLNASIVHDDWKPVSQCLIGEAQCLQRELGWIHIHKGGLVRWLRVRPPLMPIAVFLYCLFGKGLILNGRAGLFYALQRMVAEAVLSLMVLEEKLRDKAASAARVSQDPLRR